MQINNPTLKGQFDNLPHYASSNNLLMVEGKLYNWHKMLTKYGSDEYVYELTLTRPDTWDMITIHVYDDKNIIKIEGISFYVVSIDECERLIKLLERAHIYEVMPLYNKNAN